MTEVELACKECGTVIVLVDPSLDLIQYPLCKRCIERPREGCEDLTTETAPAGPGPRRV